MGTIKWIFMIFKILLQLLNKMEVVSNMIPQALMVYIYNENWNNTTLLIIVKKINLDVASNDGWQLQSWENAQNVHMYMYIYTERISYQYYILYMSHYVLLKYVFMWIN